jgi:hypothetical protein
MNFLSRKRTVAFKLQDDLSDLLTRINRKVMPIKNPDQ